MRYNRSVPRLREIAARLVGVTLALAVSTSEAAPRDPLEPPRRDPNDAPFMNPRQGGASADQARTYEAQHGPRWGHRDKVRLTLSPIFASLRIPLAGRSGSPLDPNRGGGAQLDVDVPIFRPASLWLRVTGSYSGHRLPPAFARDDEDALQKTASGGTLHIGHAAAALLYAMDRGRLQPMLELGLGPLWARTPQGVADGQPGQACRSGNLCELGSTCDTAANVCRPSTTFVVHGGVGVELEVSRRASIGVGLRYFALLSNPSVYPVYLQAAMRFGLRF